MTGDFCYALSKSDYGLRAFRCRVAFQPFEGGEEESLLFDRIGFFFCIQSIMP